MESIVVTVGKIISANKVLCKFWSNAGGWAPENAAKLMSKSRLDLQVSLSETLKIWVEKDTLSDGDLILAWANLGALLEGTLKLFFSVYLEDYLHGKRIITDGKGEVKWPDIIMLEQLKVLLHKEVEIDRSWIDYITMVQNYRNAIHFYKSREIGNGDIFKDALVQYLAFIEYVHFRFPYPDIELLLYSNV